MSDEAKSVTERILWPKYHPDVPYPGDAFMFAQGWLDDHVIVPAIQYDPELGAYSSDGKTWVVPGDEEAVAEGPIVEGPVIREPKPWEVDPEGWEQLQTPFGVFWREKRAGGGAETDLKTLLDQLVAKILPDYYLAAR